MTTRLDNLSIALLVMGAAGVGFCAGGELTQGWPLWPVLTCLAVELSGLAMIWWTGR